MTEVVIALKTIMGHLVKALGEGKEDCHGLEKETALKFMINVYKDPQKKEIDVLHEIGVLNVSDSHLHCLEDLPLTAAYSCLELFSHWLEEGFYDFNMLPSQFKAHLIPDDKLVLEELHLKWSSTLPCLKRELEELVDTLKHSENDITSQVNEKIDVSS